MVSNSERLDAVFAALGDATRRAILSRLTRGEASVTELAAPFEISFPAVAKHLRVLEDAGLVASEKEGRVRRCRLVTAPLHDAAEWLEATRTFWEGQFDALARHLEDDQP